MANELRIYQDLIGGRLSVDHTDVVTTLTSPALAALSAVGATNHMIIILDPDGRVGAPEMVKVTAHTAAATTATIVREVEGTTKRAHKAGVHWVHGTIASDHGGVQKGTGTPEGVVTAPIGTLYLRADGGANTTLYVKESGTGNTGWVAK